MTHLMIFFLVLSLGIGLGSISLLTQQYNLYKLKFLKYLLIFLISVNVVAIFGIFYNYFRENLATLSSQFINIGVETGYRLFASMILVVIFGSMIFMLRSLINQQPSKRYIKLLLSVWVLLIVFFFFDLDSMFVKSTIGTPILVNIIIDQLGQYIVMLEIIYSFYLSSTITDQINRFYSRIFIITVGIIWLSIIVFSLMRLLNLIGDDVFNLSSSFIFILFNVLPLFLLKPYLRKVYGVIDQRPATIKSYKNTEEIFLRHEITTREKDIIKLICEGYANKVIADKLCISIHTVKDHNYRIFKKLGVSNRVQLTKMFKNL